MFALAGFLNGLGEASRAAGAVGLGVQCGGIYLLFVSESLELLIAWSMACRAQRNSMLSAEGCAVWKSPG